MGIGAGALMTGLIGCIGSRDEASESITVGSKDTATPKPAETATSTTEDTSYLVTIAPVGKITFERVRCSLSTNLAMPTWMSRSG